MSIKNPVTYDNGFIGQLPMLLCHNILEIKKKECIPELEHSIFSFPYELVVESIESKKSIRRILREKNIDYTQYIGALRPYQTVGTAFLLSSPRSMIGDSVGLGKTAEISACLNILKQNKLLTKFIMAVETTALMQTQVELVKFTGMNIITMPGESLKITKVIKNTNWDEVDGIVIKHSTLKSNTFNIWLAQHLDVNKKSKMFDTFILDESSVIKNNDTQQYTYCCNIANMVDRVYLMNATAFDKHIMDIYYQFNIADNYLLPEISTIKKNFCSYDKTGSYWKKVDGKPQKKMKYELIGYKNQAIFKESLKYVYFGRSLKDVGMAVDHIYKVYTIEPTPEQLLLISGGFHSNEVLNCSSLVKDVESAGYKEIPFDRAHNPKLDRLCTLAETELEDTSFMVYCFHIEAQYKIKEELEKLGRKVVIINGEDPRGVNADKEKLSRLQKFNSGEYDVLVTNLQKSLNVYGAGALILYSTTATVGRLEQIRGRIDRHVDDKVRTFIMLLYSGTSEYDLMTSTAKLRSEASRELILDTKTAIDYFMDSMEA